MCNEPVDTISHVLICKSEESSNSIQKDRESLKNWTQISLITLIGDNALRICQEIEVCHCMTCKTRSGYRRSNRVLAHWRSIQEKFYKRGYSYLTSTCRILTSNQMSYEISWDSRRVQREYKYRKNIPFRFFAVNY